MKRLTVLTGLALCMAQNATAQDGPRPPWLIGCSNQADPAVLMCEMSQSIVLAEGNQRLATAAFLKAVGAEAVNGQFTLPVGFFLPGGLAVVIDDAEVAKLAINTCDGQGCYASAPITDAWHDAMKTGSLMSLLIERGDGEVLSFGFDLTGFSEVSSLMP